MREVARLGFVLIGLSIAFSGVEGSAHLLSFDPYGSFAPVYFASLGILVLLVFIPGCVLVARSRTFATYLFPTQDSAPDPVDIVAGGIAVLGAYLFVSGFSSAFSVGLTMAVASDLPELTRSSSESLVWGVLNATLGVVLFRHPQAVLRRLGRFERAA